MIGSIGRVPRIEVIGTPSKRAVQEGLEDIPEWNPISVRSLVRSHSLSSVGGALATFRRLL